MARQIALLRGINVGGHRKVPMARLREVLAGAGYEDVRTYVQSGNVVFTGPDRPAEDRARTLEGQLEAAFGFEIAVVIRSCDELADIAAGNPFTEIATDPARFHVLFLDREIVPERLAALEPEAHAPDLLHLRGREIYLWTPEGIRDSRLAKALTAKRLGATATARNWRTVEKLLALADAEA